MSDDMKPCPFCGDKTPYTDEASCRIFGRRTGHHFAVACSNCEVSAPGNGTMEDAIAAWNTRADLLNDPVAVHANMTAHKERAVGNEELIARLRRMSPRLDMLDCENVLTAADRIEALIAERGEHWNSFVHWREEADDRSEQLAAARQDAKAAEDYAEELEADRKKTYEALLKVSRIHGEVEAKLTKAVEALRNCPPTSNPTISAHEHLDRIGAWWRLEARPALAEIKGT